MQITVDGYVAGPNGELDWMSFKFGHCNKLEQFLHELTDSYGTILLGRKMTFVDYWENVKPDSPEFSFAKKMVDIPKVIFTKTLDKPHGKNTSLAKGSLADEIANLKKQNGKDIVVYGGAGFVSSLIQGGHIDEFIFFVNPVLINKGMRIFDLLDKRQKLSLLSSTAYDCGVAVISYKLNNDNEASKLKKRKEGDVKDEIEEEVKESFQDEDVSVEPVVGNDGLEVGGEG